MGRPFEKIGDAFGSRGRPHITPGIYVLQIKLCKGGNGHDGRKELFIAELLVVSSEGPEALPVGTEPSFVKDLKGKFPEMQIGDVADFMRAGIASLSDARGIARAGDIDQIPLDEPTADAIVKGPNILADVYVTAKAWNHITREGKDFTRIKWGVPEGQAPATPAA